MLALENTMLLNTIFMFSAQHIQHLNPYFPARPYLYHERLLRELIRYLAENGRIEDEATLVAAVLLGSFEEFHGTSVGKQDGNRTVLTLHSWYREPDTSLDF